MSRLTDYPILMCVTAFAAMWLAWLAGATMRTRSAGGAPIRTKDFDVVSAATLSLLGLIIGFTFSMSANRYEQRRNLEAVESNVIGTERQRVTLLAPRDTARAQSLLDAYLHQRILFFQAEGGSATARVNRTTDLLEPQLWESVRGPATANPSALTALAVAGMNEVLDSRGYTQAALWNRIPAAAWALMAAIALISNGLVGYGSQDSKVLGRLGLVLPLAVSIAFLLIADIDAPRRGLIRVNPENLESLATSLKQ